MNEVSNYPVDDDPFSRKFKDISPAELRQLYRGYLTDLPQRLERLSSVVKQSSSRSSVILDFSPSSFGPLGNWLCLHVSLRRRSDSELAKILTAFHVAVDPSDHRFVLDQPSFDLAADIGAYFGESFRKFHPKIKWMLSIRSRNNIDYGQPVLTGFGKAALNPTAVCVNIARKMAEDRKLGSLLIEAHYAWSEIFAQFGKV